MATAVQAPMKLFVLPEEVEARLAVGEEVKHCYRSEHGDVQINHLPLHRPSFRQLLAPPKAYPLVRRAMHAKYGEEPTFLDMADGFVCHDDHGQVSRKCGSVLHLRDIRCISAPLVVQLHVFTAAVFVVV